MSARAGCFAGLPGGALIRRPARSGAIQAGDAQGQERIGYLDGMRGLAILFTAAWHYLGPIFHMHLPYGRAFEWCPAFAMAGPA